MADKVITDSEPTLTSGEETQLALEHFLLIIQFASLHTLS